MARDVAVNSSGLSLMPSHQETQDIYQPACLTKNTSSQSPPSPLEGKAGSLGRWEQDLASNTSLRDPVGMTWSRCHYDMVGGCGALWSPWGPSLWPQLNSIQQEEIVHSDKPDWKETRLVIRKPEENQGA